MQTLYSFVRIITMATLIVLVASGDVRSSETIELKGIVVDDNGKPVAGADVLIEDDYLNPTRWQRSDEHGRFTLSVPACPDYWMNVFAVSPEKERLAETRPQLKEGVPEIPEILLVLKKARLITGTVTDETGQPVEGAIVGGTWDMPYPHVVKSDQDGHFRFAYPDDGQRQLRQVFAVHQERGMDYLDTEEQGRRADIPPEKIKNGPFSLKLAKWETFKYRVVDEHQTPIPGVSVYPAFMGKSDSEDSINIGRLTSRLFQQLTDAEGIAEVPAMSVERTTFAASGYGQVIPMPDGNRRFSGVALAHWEEFDKSAAIPTLELPSLGNVKGTVKRTDGTPVAWTQVAIQRYNACGGGQVWTDVNGEFDIPWSKPGERWNVVVESQLGAAPCVFGFDVGDGIEEKRLDFVLEKGIRLHGTVYNPDGTASEKYSINIHEKCPSSFPATILTALSDSEPTCPLGGCTEIVASRGITDYYKPESGGKYEYLLPAVRHKYDISVSSYKNPDVFLELKDYEVSGEEKDIALDFHLKLRERP